MPTKQEVAPRQQTNINKKDIASTPPYSIGDVQPPRRTVFEMKSKDFSVPSSTPDLKNPQTQYQTQTGEIVTPTKVGEDYISDRTKVYSTDTD